MHIRKGQDAGCQAKVTDTPSFKASATVPQEAEIRLNSSGKKSILERKMK
jgi:hypothetical protein